MCLRHNYFLRSRVKFVLYFTAILTAYMLFYYSHYHQYNALNNTTLITTSSQTAHEGDHYNRLFYSYSDTVDLRIILLTMNRSESLEICLKHINDMDTNGDTIALEVWIDRLENNHVDKETIDVCQHFVWPHGPFRIHIQDSHVGIQRQWIYTYRPWENSTEIVLFLEDDVDVSKYSYTWLKRAFAKYGNYGDVMGFSLIPNIVMSGSLALQPLDAATDKFATIVMYKHPGTWGLSPVPKVWRDFQEWFLKCGKDPLFRPVIPGNDVANSWYESLESKANVHTLW